MTIFYFEITLIAIIISISCSIIGVFLVLKKLSLLTDAISHSILFGIVITFSLIKNLNSPLLIVGAGLTGFLVVFLVNVLKKTKLVKEDAAIALVFPLLFSIGVILITRNFSNIHLDVDAVLMGELAFAPFERLSILGKDFGPLALYTGVLILLINISIIFLFYKELKITTFDPLFASVLGFSPILIDYIITFTLSITTVTAFYSVGSILVVALIIVPPLSAKLITNSLFKIFIFSIIFAVFNSIVGIITAVIIDVNLAGAISTVTGSTFIFCLLFAPKNGIIIKLKQKSNQKREFALRLLLIHLSNHRNTLHFNDECNIDKIYTHLGWSKEFSSKIINIILRKKLAEVKNDSLCLTITGLNLAEETMLY